MSKLWHIATKEEIEDTLNTDFERGMTNEFAQSRLKKRQKTVFDDNKKFVAKNTLSYFNSAMAILLVILSVVFMFKGKAVEATTVVILVLISELLSFLKDVLAFNSARRLRNLLKPKVTVIRDASKKVIFKDEIAQGDIIVLKKGDVVPCDGRITYCEDLTVDQKCITGNEEAIQKSCEADLIAETEPKDCTNMLYESSVIISGSCRMVACETGENTVLAQTGTLEESKKSYMQGKISEVSIVLTLFSGILLLGLLAISAFSGIDIMQAVLVCLALGTVLIPSKLPAVISYITNKGILKMAQNGNVVRNKSIAEQLAVCDTVVFGKTGVLTQDEAEVTEIISSEGCVELGNADLSVPQKSISKIILEFASLCTKENDSACEEQTIDSAVLKAAQKVEALPKGVEIAKVYPFDMDKKTMTVCASFEEGYRIITKGDVKKILDICSHAVSTTKLEELTDELKQSLTEQYEEKLKNGYKVIALAYKDSGNLPEEDLAGDFTLLGILVIENKINKQTTESISQLLSAGIRPVMVSYDDEILCKAVALKCGIIQEDEQVVTGKMTEEMSDELLDETTKTVFVYAELSPNQKERIVKSLKRNGKTVCMISLSSSDKKAMECADISVSKKDGAQVNEFNAGLVTDGTLFGLANAMKYAQKLYLDVRKSIRFAVSGAISIMFFMIFAVLLTNSLPLSYIHTLLIGIITTGILPFIMPSGFCADKHQIKNVKENKTIFLKMWPRIIGSGVFAAVLALALFVKIKYFAPSATDAESILKASTTVFLFFVFYQLLSCLDLRRTAFLLKEGKSELLLVVGIAVLVVAFTTCVICIPAFKNLFGFANSSVLSAVLFGAIYVVFKIVQEVFITFKKRKTEALDGADI